MGIPGQLSALVTESIRLLEALLGPTETPLQAAPSELLHLQDLAKTQTPQQLFFDSIADTLHFDSWTMPSGYDSFDDS